MRKSHLTLMWNRFHLRCYEVICDLRTGALGVYQDVLTLWKDADPDIPILMRAKAEYKKCALSDAQSGRVQVPLTPK